MWKGRGTGREQVAHASPTLVCRVGLREGAHAHCQSSAQRFVHSFNKYLCSSGFVPSAENTAENKAGNVPCPCGADTLKA